MKAIYCTEYFRLRILDSADDVACLLLNWPRIPMTVVRAFCTFSEYLGIKSQLDPGRSISHSIGTLLSTYCYMHNDGITFPL